MQKILNKIQKLEEKKEQKLKKIQNLKEEISNIEQEILLEKQIIFDKVLSGQEGKTDYEKLENFILENEDSNEEKGDIPDEEI